MGNAWGMEGHGYFFAGIFWGILKVLLSLRNGVAILAIVAIVAIIAMVDAVGGDEGGGGDGDGAGAMNRVPTI